MERALAVGVDAWLQLQNRDLAFALVETEIRRIDHEDGKLFDKATLPADYLDKAGALIGPSRSTFDRRCRATDRLTVDMSMFGVEHARKHNRTWAVREIPDRPYQEVEVDHCTLDIAIIDVNGLILGRPDLVFFRDRATAMILGFEIGFDAPSHHYIDDLRHDDQDFVWAFLSITAAI